MKKSLSSIATSFKGVYINTTLEELRRMFGENQFYDGEDEKVTHEWRINTETGGDVNDGEGIIITIYDWKEYREIKDDEILQWHVGGINVTKAEIKKFLLSEAGIDESKIEVESNEHYK